MLDPAGAPDPGLPRVSIHKVYNGEQAMLAALRAAALLPACVIGVEAYRLSAGCRVGCEQGGTSRAIASARPAAADHAADSGQSRQHGAGCWQVQRKGTDQSRNVCFPDASTLYSASLLLDAFACLEIFSRASCLHNS